MRLIQVTSLALALAALLAIPVYAAGDNVQVRGRVAISLGDFDIVIGDLGDRSDNWSASPTRVHFTVLDGRRTREHYFDSLPAALFVLREMYGTPRIVQFDVPDYAYGGLIDGAQAYYVLDSGHYSRGGLPLVLAFSDYNEAYAELRYREGAVLDFDELVLTLTRWSDRDRDRIYWRGWDRPRWERDNWDQAWNSRWAGWNWDRDRGWGRLDGGRGQGERDRRERGRDDRGWDQRDRERGDNNNGGQGRERTRDREQGDRNDGRDRERTRERERDNHNNDGQGRDRARERERDDRNDGQGRDRTREREREENKDGEGRERARERDKDGKDQNRDRDKDKGNKQSGREKGSGSKGSGRVK